MRTRPTFGYLFFENHVAIPDYVSLGKGQIIPVDLPTLLLPNYGLVLPLGVISIDDGIPVALGKPTGERPAYITLGADNQVGACYPSDGEGEEAGTVQPYASLRKRFIVLNDAIAETQFNRHIETVVSMDTALMSLEKFTGMSAMHYRVYDREQLIAYIRGDIELADITFYHGVSQYSFTWLGERNPPI